MQAHALSIHRPLAGARARIIAFPHAGGGASAFARLRVALAGYAIDLCALQPPGRENRTGTPRAASLDALVDDFESAVTTLPPCPTAFLGHSFGGLAAFLLAARLAGGPHAPVHLVVSASRSPLLATRPDQPASEADLRARIAALGGVPEAIRADPVLLAMFEAEIIADMRLAESHRHEPHRLPACPVTVYAAEADSAAPPALAATWRPLAPGGFASRRFAGDHFYLYRDPDRIAGCLVGDLGWSRVRQAATS